MPKLALLSLACVALAGSSPRLLVKVETGASPAGAVAAFGAVWVSNDGAGTLARIDPRTNRVKAASTSNGAPPTRTVRRRRVLGSTRVSVPSL